MTVLPNFFQRLEADGMRKHDEAFALGGSCQFCSNGEVRRN